MLAATTILSDFRSGSSLPVLVETTRGTTCVVKWKGAGEGPIANAVDWACLHLARHIGIPVPQPLVISISSSLIDRKRDPDINDLIERSLGLNLGVEYLENASPYTHRVTHRIDPSLKNLIYLFDVLFLNVDRTDCNPNMVFSREVLYCIDFSAAMTMKKLMNGQNHSERALLSVVRRHPFYRKLSDVNLINLAVDTNAVNEIVRSIPDEWLTEPEAAKQRVALGLVETIKDAHSILEHRLAILDTVPLESDEERRIRTLRNRRAFEARWLK